MLKGTIFYFNTLNSEGILGHYFNWKSGGWVDIEQEGFTLNSDPVANYQPSYYFPIVIIPYLG